MTITASPSRPDTAGPPARRTRGGPLGLPRRWTVAGAVALVLLGVLAIQTWWPAAAAADPALFLVQRRDFSVDLPQKGELRAAQSVDVRCEVEGRSTIIWLVPEGTRVQKGDLLVELASNEIEDRIRSEEINVANAESNYLTAKTDYEIQIDQNASDIRKANLALENAEDEFNKYKEGDWIQQQTSSLVAVERAQKELDQARDRFNDSKELREQGFITKREYESDELALFVAEKELEQATLAKEILHKYTHNQAMRQKRADVEEAQKELDRIKKGAEAKERQKRQAYDSRTRELEIARDRLARYRRQKENTRIVAPAPGMVVYYSEARRWGGGDEIKEGAEVRERQTLITLPDTSRMKVIVRIHEAAATKISTGLPATVEIEGHSDRVFKGKVTRVADLVDSQDRWLNPDLKEYETEITLDEVGEDLKPGVTARARIHIEDVTNALAVPVQAVFSSGSRHYVFRDSRRGVEAVPVVLGSSSDQFVQITDGLKEGDRIRLAVSDELKRQIPSRGEQNANGPQPPDALADRPAGAPAPETKRAARASAGSRVPQGTAMEGRPPARPAGHQADGAGNERHPRPGGPPGGRARPTSAPAES